MPGSTRQLRRPPSSKTFSTQIHCFFLVQTTSMLLYQTKLRYTNNNSVGKNVRSPNESLLQAVCGVRKYESGEEFLQAWSVCCKRIRNHSRGEWVYWMCIKRPQIPFFQDTMMLIQASFSLLYTLIHSSRLFSLSHGTLCVVGRSNIFKSFAKRMKLK